MRIITLPGIEGSDENHWQTHWERARPGMTRFRPSSWDVPDRADWEAALESAVGAGSDRPVLVAHSLACLLVAHSAARLGSAVRGAFLVSVPNPEGPAFPAAAASFSGAPSEPFAFPALVVASSTDPFGTLDYMRARAKAWGAGFVVAGPLGHINSAGNLGAWPQGAALLDAFLAGLAVHGADR